MTELDYLLNEHAERIAYLTDALARGGSIKSMEQYQYVCGQIRGLEAACLSIKDLKTRKENSDNE